MANLERRPLKQEDVLTILDVEAIEAEAHKEGSSNGSTKLREIADAHKDKTEATKSAKHDASNQGGAYIYWR